MTAIPLEQDKVNDLVDKGIFQKRHEERQHRLAWTYNFTPLPDQPISAEEQAVLGRVQDHEISGLTHVPTIRFRFKAFVAKLKYYLTRKNKFGRWAYKIKSKLALRRYMKQQRKAQRRETAYQKLRRELDLYDARVKSQ